MYYCWDGDVFNGEEDTLPDSLLAALGLGEPKELPDALLIINTVETAKELSELPGIGVSSAEKILTNRRDDGEFLSFEDLKNRVIDLPRNFDWAALLAYEAK